ncbi:tnf receptor [Raccoonpox virus]|nr:tnf receptor [Raccoonpox virus]
MISHILLLSVLCIHINGDSDMPYTPIDGKCKGGDYKNGNLCCSSCSAGTYASKLCDSSNNTVCTTCGDGTFTAISNHLPACLSCNGACNENQIEIQSCTKTQNRICSCAPGNYCLFTGSGKGCKLCTPKTKCGIGYGVTGHTSQGNTICSKCGLKSRCLTENIY